LLSFDPYLENADILDAIYLDPVIFLLKRLPHFRTTVQLLEGRLLRLLSLQ